MTTVSPFASQCKDCMNFVGYADDGMFLDRFVLSENAQSIVMTSKQKSLWFMP